MSFAIQRIYIAHNRTSITMMSCYTLSLTFMLMARITILLVFCCWIVHLKKKGGYCRFADGTAQYRATIAVHRTQMSSLI